MAKRRNKKKLVRLARAKGKISHSESKENNVCQVKRDFKPESSEITGNIDTKRDKHVKGTSGVTDVKVLHKTMAGRKYVSRKLKRQSDATDTNKVDIQPLDNAHESSSAESEEVFLQTRIEDGMTCMDVECGPNQAVMDPAKLCVGSKGACIRYMDAWLTPNEFQLVSGRETAKDWKRSIKHNGKSLKLLIVNGLIKMGNSKDGKRFKGIKKKANIHSVQESSKVHSPQEGNANEVEDIDKYNGIEQTVAAEEVDDTIAEEISAVNVPTEDAVCGISLEKPMKKRSGRKPKKTRARVKRNVPPLESSCQDDSKGDLSDPPATIHEAEEVPVTIQRKAEIEEETPERTSPLPLPADEGEIKTEEEKRLDEFVKVLSLNKTTEKADPCEAIPQERVPSPHEDSEMPILKMEMNVDPPDLPMQGLPVDSVVNPFHATVTPPPTPPTDSPEPEDLVNKQVDKTDAFKSRLSPVDEGLKLVINRQQTHSHMNVKVTSPVNTEDAIKAKDMLFDALTSARKFKEQLRNQYERQSVIHVPTNSDVAQKQAQGTNANICVNTRSDTNTTFNSGTHVAKHNSDKKSFLTVHDMISKDIKRTLDVDTRNGSPPVSASSVQLEHPTVTKHVEQHRIPSSSMSGNSKPHRNPHNSSSRPRVNPSEAAGISSYRNDLMTSRSHIPDNSLSFHPSPMTTQMFLALSHQLYQNMYVPPLFPYPHMSTEDLSALRSDIDRRTGPATTERKRKLSQHKESDSDAPLDLSMKKAKHDFEYRSEQEMAQLSRKPSELAYTPCGDYKNKFHVKHGNTHTHEYMPTYFTDNYLSGSIANEHSFYHPDLRKPDWTFGYTSAKDRGFRHPLCRCNCKQEDDVRTWSVDKVCSFLRGVDGCKSYTKTFHDQGINGRLLPYLTTQHLTRTLGMKVGPALSLQQAVDQLVKNNATFHPCTLCRSTVSALQ